MSTANVVDLTSRRPERNEPMEGAALLLAKIREIAVPALRDGLQRAFTEVDDTLFEMSEKATDGTAKTRYFEDLRSIRRTRDAAMERYDACLRGSYMLFTHGRPLTGSASVGSSDELSLVEEDDLEASLAVSRIATRCDDSVARPRLELTKRLFAIVRRAEPEQPETPFSGKVIAEAVKLAVGQLQVGIESKLIFLKRVERHVGNAIALAIEESNKLCFEAGVLPELKLTYTRRSHDGAAATPAAAAAQPPVASTMAAADLSAIAQEITRLLSASRPRTALPPGASPGLEFDAPAVERALAQAVDPGQLQGDQFAAALRAQLTTGPDGTPNTRVLTEPVENAIDLVALMFDFVARDEALPAEIKQAMTPLRMPLLRSALRGAHVFDSAEHPLRALMESTAELGRSWSPESDRDGRVLDQIKNSIASAVTESNLDESGVERAHTDLRAFMANEHKRAQLLEKRSAEAAQAQERRLASQRTSQQVIADVLEQTPVPPVVGTLLNGPLRRHLELIHSRRGDDSKDWKSAKKLVRDLVWSFDPVTIEVERNHWQAMLPTIVGALRGALSVVGMHDNDIDGVVQEFRNRYKELIATTQQQPGQSPHSFERIDPEEMADAPEPVVDAASVEPPQEIVAEAQKMGLTYTDALAQVRTLATGSWFDLQDLTKGETQRAKLIWNSATTQRSLFVNRNGQLIADRPWHHVATELMAGHMRRVEDGALFERALVSMKRKLVDAQGARPH